MMENMDRGQSAPASANGSGRGSDGKFALGNVGGPGNPFGRRVAHVRKLIQEAISDAEITAALRKLHAMAMEGSVPAMKLLLQYVAGKPVPVANPDRVNHEEWELRKELPTAAEMEDQEFNRMPHRAAIGLHRLVDIVKMKNLRGQMERRWAKAEARERRKAERERRRQARKDNRR